MSIMNKALIHSGLVLAACGLTTTVRAGDQDDFWGRFNLSYQAAFNFSAHFSGVGGYPPPANGASGVYNDGFVGVDSTGNAGGLTTYWGFNNDNQVVGNDVVMHRYQSATVSTGDMDPGVQHGFELSYQQAIGGGQHWTWGVEAALNWMDISFTDSRPLTGALQTTTDAYSLNGSIAPLAPYTGPYDGSGPLLSTTPDSHSVSTQLNAASITGDRNIDADLFGFRVGPYAEFPLGKYFSVALSGGLSLGLIRSDFSYHENVVISGLPTYVHSGSGSDWGALVGGYLRAQGNVRLSDHWSLLGGVEWNDLGTYNQRVGTETAHLDLSTGIYISVGASYRF